MLNKEKYAKQIFEIACAGERISIKDGKLVACSASHCGDCEFGNPAGRCEENIKRWCESEYVELSRKGVSITIPRKDFESHWKEVE